MVKIFQQQETWELLSSQAGVTPGSPFQISSSIADQIFLNSNYARRGAMFFNDSKYILYINYAGPAASTSYWTKIFPQEYYEMSLPLFFGEVHGIWNKKDVAGFAMVSEFL